MIRSIMIGIFLEDLALPAGLPRPAAPPRLSRPRWSTPPANASLALVSRRQLTGLCRALVLLSAMDALRLRHESLFRR
jgi:hypothetical protein